MSTWQRIWARPRVVAVKVIAPRWAAEPQFLARFQREAQACGRLRHPNIVNVTDFGIARAASGDMPYLVMEFLDGQTLSDFQKANPQISLPLIADLLDQIGLALAEAHRHGIVHRDLKPDNIWLEPNGRGGYTVKVLDFGVAKVNLLGDWAPPLKETPEASAPQTVTPRPVMPGDELETAVIETNEPGAAEETETVAIAPTSTPAHLPDRSTAAPARKPCRAAWSEPRVYVAGAGVGPGNRFPFRHL
jgi:serine/threonine protein kinase